MAHPVVEGFRKEWPPAFAGPKLNELSGNAIRWSTTQNRRSRRQIPDECFVRGGARLVIVLRDPFLDWWATTLPEASSSPAVPVRRTPRRRRQGRADEIAEPVPNAE
jgi:hypothetical protein